VDAGRTMSAEKMPTEILPASKPIHSGGPPANQAAAACSLDVDYCSYSRSLDRVSPLANPGFAAVQIG
jgi:hypothetical protein